MKRLLFFAAILSVGFFSCKKDRDPKRDRANVTVKLTDAPGAFSAVMLNVKEVIIITDQGQQSFPVNAGLVNILRYRNGRDTVIAGGDVPAGNIQQIRLVLNENGNRVVVNGTSQDLTTPSGQTSGVKLNLQQTLTPGVAYTIKLDFDVTKSIVLTGNGKYILKPVIRAIADATSGVLTGTVSPATSMPKVYAIAGTDTVGTMADADGRFYFQGLAAGTYSVRFEPLSPYQVKTVTGVTVSTGQVKDMGVVPMN
ncbi:DUF4382 domain-containing protein [Mucilaginibacter auburnensis]|uniref:Uncharacterized protein DUF4382 n=1 Tax=Mucilaginibacter auburnensis TaxID=1457233 RepID=A0A2H9VST7_9SPHI|nr:DUF4382 domain-containing protein [Mucilaginibacter auburnensis]PJJ83875.1 uncharacterized protein DUF4382 [Mucilaginibacter auburnensis]